jgi:hypothetical protein
MIIRKNICTFIVLISCFLVNSQDIITTSGSYEKSSTTSISWTLGELVTSSYINDSISFCQGFQQPDLSITIVDQIPEIDYNISIAPNPVSEFITLNIDEAINTKIEYNIIDISGNILYKNNVISNKTEIQFTSFKSGTYLLKIVKSNIIVKTFKIVKK